MFNPFKWWSDYRLERLKLKLNAQNKPFELMSEAIRSQASFLQQWLDNFKVTDLPASTIIRDQDEYIEEQARERFGTSELNSGVRESIQNGIRAGAFPELADILGPRL
jgi:hypothetical protein